MKPRPTKPNPAAATPEESSALSLLRKIQDGSVHPSNLPSEARQSVVEHLSAEGYSTAEIAEILKTSERTIARDRKTIRQANAVERDPVMVGQMVGQLLLEAQNCITRIRRAARDKEAAPAVRVDAEHRVYQIFSDLIQRLQGLGYLPSATQKIDAQLTHNVADWPSGAQMKIEIEELQQLEAQYRLPDESPGSDLDSLIQKVEKLSIIEELANAQAQHPQSINPEETHGA